MGRMTKLPDILFYDRFFYIVLLTNEGESSIEDIKIRIVSGRCRSNIRTSLGNFSQLMKKFSVHMGYLKLRLGLGLWLSLVQCLP